MRALLPFAAALLVAVPAQAQQAPAADAQLAALQQQLLAAEQEIARLRAEATAAQEAGARLTECRARNARLIAIGNELIGAYGARYRRGSFLPFDIGRRKFETELQAVGDRVYENHVDAAPAKPVAAGDTPPAQAANPDVH